MGEIANAFLHYGQLEGDSALERQNTADMRFMLDTMIFDLIAADGPFAEAVRDAADAGRITIVTTHVQEDQIAEISDEEKRSNLSRIPRCVVPTTGVRVGCIEARDAT